MKHGKEKRKGLGNNWNICQWSWWLDQ